MKSFFSKIVGSKYFKNSVTAAILLAGVILGLETYREYLVKYSTFLSTLEDIILSVFVVEIIFKMLVHGNKPWKYFYDSWNVFDFIIVASAFMPFGSGSIAILRLLRLLRVLKLVKALPKLQVLVSALLKSIPSMGYVSLLLLLLFYIYAVAGVTFFSENDPIHFSSLHVSMLSLFRVVTLEDWTDIMYINMYGCANYGYRDVPELCTQSQGYPIGAALFFVSFVLIGTMIVMNLFVGVIMNGMEEARAGMEIENHKSSQGTESIVIEIEEKISEMQEILLKLKSRK